MIVFAQHDIILGTIRNISSAALLKELFFNYHQDFFQAIDSFCNYKC